MKYSAYHLYEHAFDDHLWLIVMLLCIIHLHEEKCPEKNELQTFLLRMWCSRIQSFLQSRSFHDIIER